MARKRCFGCIILSTRYPQSTIHFLGTHYLTLGGYACFARVLSTADGVVCLLKVKNNFIKILSTDKAHSEAFESPCLCMQHK